MHRFARRLRLLAIAAAFAALPAIALAQTPPKPPPAAPGEPATTTTTAQPPPLPAATPQPPPLPAPADLVFFYALNGQQAGPVGGAELAALIAAGTINRDTLVWTAGMPEWRPAGDVDALLPLLATAVPPLPQDELFRQLVIGTWFISQDTAGGFTTTMEIRYTADGRYSGAMTTIFQGLATPVPLSGRWSLVPIDDGRFVLTNTPDVGLPSTSTVRVIDQNTLFNETENYEVRRRG